MIFLPLLLMPKLTSLIIFSLRVLILVQVLLHVSLTFSDPPPGLLCTPEQVLHLIHQLPTDTSPGPDGISSKMLKSTAYFISHPLSLLFNQSISFGTFPSEWKCSHITPISKFTSPSSPSCYRPISLLSLVSKLLEKHISLWMHNFCSQNNILSDGQFGFRPGFSTESALISTTHLWQQTLDSSSSICAVFFDLSKAFDSIPHSPLLDSLSSLHLPPNLLHWFLFYLSNRSQ